MFPCQYTGQEFNFKKCKQIVIASVKSFEADTFSSKSKYTLQDKIKILIFWAKKHDTFNL
jgi:hypothetical protein